MAGATWTQNKRENNELSVSAEYVRWESLAATKTVRRRQEKSKHGKKETNVRFEVAIPIVSSPGTIMHARHRGGGSGCDRAPPQGKPKRAGDTPHRCSDRESLIARLHLTCDVSGSDSLLAELSSCRAANAAIVHEQAFPVDFAWAVIRDRLGRITVRDGRCDRSWGAAWGLHSNALTK